jgi:hypothetical protein
VITVIIGAVIAYLAFHVGAGHIHHRYRKASGLRPNFYWSSVRGPYASGPAARRVPHRASAVNLWGRWRVSLVTARDAGGGPLPGLYYARRSHRGRYHTDRQKGLGHGPHRPQR